MSKADVNKHYNVNTSQKVLLVLGGSSGSRKINDIVYKVLPSLGVTISVIHQTGELSEEVTLPKSQAQYIQAPFFTDNYFAVLQRADVVLARAGSGTLWEIANAGIPSIIVPLPKSQSRGDQIENAQYFAKAGAIENLGFDPDIKEVQKAITSIISDSDHANRLKEGCFNLCVSDAASKYAKIIEKYV